MRTFVARGRQARALQAGDPWVHARGLEEVEPGGGEDVALVVDAQGRTIGRGLVSEGSAIRIRLLDDVAERTGVEELLEARIRAAAELRRRLFPEPARTNAYRLVHAEGDRLPGLVVDRLDDVLVAQFATSPMHRRRERLSACLLRATGASSLVTRPAGYEREEGIDPRQVDFEAGVAPPEVCEIREEGVRYVVEPRRGQKTGHYADQRENRRLVADLAAGRHVLDLYAGTGGFSLQALLAGAASSLAVESSPRAAGAARTNARANHIPDERLEVREEDARHVLQELKREGRSFDVIVLDPPNFFPRRGASAHAVKAYRDLNVQALTRVASGGILATFCCSAELASDEFAALVASSARECRRTLRVLRPLVQGPDHPVLAAAPTGRYLSGLLAVVDA